MRKLLTGMIRLLRIAGAVVIEPSESRWFSEHLHHRMQKNGESENAKASRITPANIKAVRMTLTREEKRDDA